MTKELERKRGYSEQGNSGSAVLRSEPGHVDGIVPLNGEQFAKYLLVGEIARGGMGEVFLGVQHGLEGFSKVVVVKRVVRHLTNNAEFVRMFIDEARLAARLEHPNIVKTYEFGDHDGQYYTVMEFLAGEDLRKLLHMLHLPPRRRLALPLAVHIVAQICNGLHFAHELTDHEGGPLNLVHRDVNPANVIVTYTGEVKVIDFGVAKVNTTTKKTLAGVIKGKIAYMSPEHILARDVDRRSDIFSTGIILWEMLMGRPLFARDCDASTMYAVMNDPIPRPSKERPDVPPVFDTIVARALARSPDERFATADDMRAALEEFAATLPKCDARAVGRMMENVFGRTRAQAKRSITQSRSLARNISLVMRATASLPTVVLPAATAPSVAPPPTVASPSVARPAVRRPRRRLVIESVIASLCGVAAIAVFGPWRGTSPHSLPESPLRPPELAIKRAATLAVAAVAPGAVADGAASLAAPLPRVVTGGPAQGTLTLETAPNAMVYLDGEPIEQGSFTNRRTANGTHELMAQLPGRAPVRRLISIVADRETRLKIELAPRLAAVALHQRASDRAGTSSNRPPTISAPPEARGSGSSADNERVPVVAEPKPEVAKIESPAVPAVKQPSLDVAATRTAVRSQIGPLQQCYERAKMDDANLRGDVTARITVTVDGSIANVQISHSTLNSPQIEGCIAREIVRWRLPRPSGGAAVSFLYPFVFE